jgi:hypothetical protein
MIRYEANANGQIIIGEPFTEFNEVSVLEEVFSRLNWRYELLKTGRGGYFLFEIIDYDDREFRMHTYLKRITFGGRESRPYEKRAQFPAGLDRTGFDVTRCETDSEFSVILGLYKSELDSDVVICAWSIHDWGYNVGRAFNCFTNIEYIGKAIRKGFVQHTTSIGQIVCCFRPDMLSYYLENRESLHEKIEEKQHNATLEVKSVKKNQIPKYYDLFQLVIDILRDNEGKAEIGEIENEAANRLELSNDIRLQIHNKKEGFRTELGYQLAWTRNYLKRAGLIYNPYRSIWALTDTGWNTYDLQKDEVTRTAKYGDVESDVESDDEKLTINSEEGIELEIENEESGSKITHPFDPNLVDIRTRTMSLDLILKRLRSDAINMSTGFQRKANLWNNDKQSRLIESILVKFPLPAFYFDGSDDNKWLVVDGLQRLSSLDNYVNKQLFGLQGLEFLTQFEGYKFNQLPGYLQRRIEEFEITAYVIAAGTPKVLKFNVFKRINTGGLILTSQEIRNALNQGRPSEFVKRLAGLKSFKLATNYSISEDRMLDQEFVTRFLAFYLFDIETEYNSDLESFLNSAMDHLYLLDDSAFDSIEKDFDKSMKASLLIFGDDAFRKRYHRNDRRKPINKALFDSWSVSLAKLLEDDITILISQKEKLQDLFINLLNTDELFNKSITSATGDKSRVRKRFTEIYTIIQSIITQ